MSKAKALAAIEKHGALLVYPLQNRQQPMSLWSALYPKSKMVWEWDAGADGRVSSLWILREELSRSRQVVYAKWYQNRATFFSREVFINMLAYLRELPIPPNSREVLEIFEMDSPLSTKQIKEAAGLQGKDLESAYNRAMKPLWQTLRVVGFGEIEDSSFPSLAVGATSTLFEDLWEESQSVEPEKAEKFLSAKLGEENLFWKFAQKIKKTSSAGQSARA